MNERNCKKRLDFQQKIISRKSEEIDMLKIENEKLRQELQKKDEVIASVETMRKEMAENINEIKQKKNEYKQLIRELKMMKSIVNQEVYKKRWWLIKLFLK